MNDPVEFTTEDGFTVRMGNDTEGNVIVVLRMGQPGDRREVSFRLNPMDAQTFINGLVIANQQPIVGAWGWHGDRAIHIPSYKLGHAEAVEEFS